MSSLKVENYVTVSGQGDLIILPLAQAIILHSLRSLFLQCVGSERQRWALCAALRDVVALLADSPASLGSVKSAIDKDADELICGIDLPNVAPK